MTTTTEQLNALPEQVQQHLLDIWTRATTMTPDERAMGRLLLGGICITVACAGEPRHVEAGHLVADANSVLMYVDDLARELSL